MAKSFVHNNAGSRPRKAADGSWISQAGNQGAWIQNRAEGPDRASVALHEEMFLVGWMSLNRHKHPNPSLHQIISAMPLDLGGEQRAIKALERLVRQGRVLAVGDSFRLSGSARDA